MAILDYTGENPRVFIDPFVKVICLPAKMAVPMDECFAPVHIAIRGK